MIREVHTGKVLSNVDPAKAGGLKVQVDTLEEGTALRDGEFIPPSFPFAGSDVGFFFIPPKGALVEVEVESDDEKATEEMSPRWRAVLYTNTDKIPTEFASDYPNRAGIKFGSDLLLFDQTKDLLALISSKVRLGEENASHPVMRGDTFNTELSTYLTAENAYQTVVNARLLAEQAAIKTWSLLTAGTPATTDMLIAYATAMTVPQTAEQAGGITWQAAISAFAAKLVTWLSTKVKTE